ncbi:MAG: SIMPL domain-containing protein, partial [Geminicoccaceae bacterium]
MSYRNALSCLFLAVLAAWPLAGAFAQAPLTRLYLQESASREVEQNVLVATIQAHAESASPAEAQAAVNETMAVAVDRVRTEAAIRAATGSYSVYQRRDRDNRPVGWVADQDLRLTSKDPAALLELAGSLQE